MMQIKITLYEVLLKLRQRQEQDKTNALLKSMEDMIDISKTDYDGY